MSELDHVPQRKKYYRDGRVRRHRASCGIHLISNRSWNEYEFWMLDFKGIEIWRCKQCKRRERLTRIHDKIESQRRHVQYQKNIAKLNSKIINRQKQAEDELWDHVVIRDLRRGMKYKGYVEFPKELIQLHRATMRLKRDLKEKRKQIREAKKAARKKVELKKKVVPFSDDPEIRALDPWVDCDVHGKVRGDEIIKAGKNRSGTYRYKCQACNSQAKKEHYVRNRERVYEKNRKWKADNPERSRQLNRESKERSKWRRLKTCHNYENVYSVQSINSKTEK